MITFPGQVLVLDIEGTLSEIAFVHEVLFPYIREKVGEFLRHHSLDANVVEVLELMARDDKAPRFSSWCPYPWGTSDATDWIIQRIHRWMDQDAKLTGLKSLQGLIWSQGYADGTLRSHVFSDVPPALEAWYRAGCRIAIYSSGSQAAQKLLFAHTVQGDLTRWISEYFDTTVGAKREISSYQTIAYRLGCQPHEILFLSDVPEELEAASAADMKTGLVVRRGNRGTSDSRHPRLYSLEEVRLISG